MKKFCLEFAILTLAFGMFALVGVFPQSVPAALFALGGELLLGLTVARLYALLEKEERRLARRARRDARAHHAAQMYRAGVRLGSSTEPAPQPSARHAPDLRIA